MSKLLAHAKNNAVAYLALFVALGGTGYAAISIPAGSVGTRQLRNRAVTQSKLGKGSVSAPNLNSKSIAGYVAFWAHIAVDGKVVGSSPRATVTTPSAGRGLFVVTWNRPIPRSCFLLSSVTDETPPTAAYANALFEAGLKNNKGAYVQTFNGAGLNVPEPVNVAVICP
jgi:hypothetical protein